MKSCFVLNKELEKGAKERRRKRAEEETRAKVERVKWTTSIFRVVMSDKKPAYSTGFTLVYDFKNFAPMMEGMAEKLVGDEFEVCFHLVDLGSMDCPQQDFDRKVLSAWDQTARAKCRPAFLPEAVSFVTQYPQVVRGVITEFRSSLYILGSYDYVEHRKPVGADHGHPEVFRVCIQEGGTQATLAIDRMVLPGGANPVIVVRT